MIKKISKSDLQLMPWKNGGGLTAQIAIEPRSAQFPDDVFLWRLSTAFVKMPGPFSQFENYERVLIVVSGEGLELNGKVLPRLSPFYFSGSEHVFARPLSSEIQDLGVIFNSSQVAVVAEVLTEEFYHHPVDQASGWSYLYCVAGFIRCGDLELLAGDFLDLGAESGHIQFGQNTQAILLKINSII